MSVGVEAAPIGRLRLTSNVPVGRHQGGRSAGGSGGRRPAPLALRSAISPGLSGSGAVGEELLTRPPAGPSRRTRASRPSGRRSLQATLAPYRDRASAMPLPMLGPVPVTSATLPAREPSISPTTSFVASMLVRQRPMFDYDVV